MNVPPLLTIGIISHGQNQLVSGLLECLERVEPGMTFQVVVIENLQDQLPLPIERFSFPIHYLKNNKIQGFAANHNKIFGLFGKDSEFFCVLNPDIRFDIDVFSLLLKTLQTGTPDIVAPFLFDSNGVAQDSFRELPNPFELVSRYTGLSKTKIFENDLPEIIFPVWIAGMFLLMPSKIFASLGGFDEKYRLYFEDVDFCLRARQSGYTLGVHKNIQVTHDSQRISHKNFRFLLIHIRSAIQFFTSRVYWNELISQ